ncbi:MAG: SDR family oxidoreductase [Syntrophaceae bacterium]|nr:SDR family oxidoreductase [Syntrophaceae bacterium]
MNLQFNGQNALILGGSCDLALTLAATMKEAKLHPILTFRNEKGRKKIDTRLSSFPKEAYDTLHLDFGDRETLKALLAQKGGDVEFVVDFAQDDFEDYVALAAEERVYQYFQNNISFRAELLKKISRIMMKRKRGRLVFVSSVAAARAKAGQGFYAAAKLASEALYKNLGIELGAKGITTVILRPGYIQAGRGKKYLESHNEEALQLVPTRRFLTEEEVAQAILFLLSESAAGFNATELTMDGGMTACK